MGVLPLTVHALWIDTYNCHRKTARFWLDYIPRRESLLHLLIPSSTSQENDVRRNLKVPKLPI